ncbi:hypothetical protein Trydic_g17787 [Trypoxylus dichotomus]
MHRLDMSQYVNEAQPHGLRVRASPARLSYRGLEPARGKNDAGSGSLRSSLTTDKPGFYTLEQVDLRSLAARGTYMDIINLRPEHGDSEKRHPNKPEMALSIQAGDSCGNPPLRKKKPSGAERRKRKAARETAMAQPGTKATREARTAKPEPACLDLTTIKIQWMHNSGTRDLLLGSAYLPYDQVGSPPTSEVKTLMSYAGAHKLQLLLGCDANAHHTIWGRHQ